MSEIKPDENYRVRAKKTLDEIFVSHKIKEYDERCILTGRQLINFMDINSYVAVPETYEGTGLVSHLEIWDKKDNIVAIAEPLFVSTKDFDVWVEAIIRRTLSQAAAKG